MTPVSMVLMDCVFPAKGGGLLFVLHSNIHTTSVDTHAGVLSVGLEYPQSFGSPLSIEKQFSAQTPAKVIHDPVPISEGTQIRDKQGH